MEQDVNLQVKQMEERELYKTDSRRVALYNRPIEFLRLFVLILYISAPIYTAYKFYIEGSIFNGLPLVTIVLLSLGCFFGIAFTVFEELDSHNKCWKNSYTKASYPVTFVFFFSLISEMGPSAFLVETFYNKWFSWFNFYTAAIIFAVVFIISYLTQIIVNPDNREKHANATFVGGLFVGLIWLIGLSVSIFPLILSGIISMLIGAALSFYPNTRIYTL